MMNLNGSIVEQQKSIDALSRGFLWGDSVYDLLQYDGRRLIFWEEHYLRLMASMRIVRMHIPNTFTPEWLEQEVQKCLLANELQGQSAWIRLQVFRQHGAELLPQSREVGYCISAEKAALPFYQNLQIPYEIELFKDYFLPESLLSTLKLSQQMPHTLASIFAHENQYQNALMLNTSKNVVGFSSGNVFVVQGQHFITPPLNDGAVNGIVRKKLIDIIEKTPEWSIEQRSISPFELQKADEIFLSSTKCGVQSVSKYRKKEYARALATNLLGKLNAAIRLS